MNLTTTENGSRDGAATKSRRPWLETPLDNDRPCIRILKLHKGFGTMPIACDLNVAWLDDHPSYEVLSYVWGDPAITTAVTVGGATFQVTKNLFDFLVCLRSPTADRFLWADAICIDQTNDMERDSQIGLMTMIYQNAVEAHIWFGPFTQDWEEEMKGDKNYTLLCEMTPNLWTEYEWKCLAWLKYFKAQEGFKPLSRTESQEFERRCLDDIFGHTLLLLERMAHANGTEHLYTYPVYILNDEQSSHRKYEVNRSWLLVMDCIRWLLTRPWWSRVWTLQEAVLPLIDPTVHAPPHSFKLSRLLNGIYAMLFHNQAKCCKWFGGVILALPRDAEDGAQFTQPLAIYEHRNSLKDSRQDGLPLAYIVRSIQRRTATDIRDHWFGVFGFLPSSWQEADKLCNEEWTTTELFTKFTKLLYFACEDLTRLDLARRLRQSKVPGLPSWAIDLTAQRTDEEADYERWMLYDAAKGTAFESVREWRELKTPDLIVKAIRLGTVSAPGQRIPSGSIKGRNSEKRVLECVKDWRQHYRDKVHPANEDGFWRAVFMDRDIEEDRMHQRTSSLLKSQVTNINEWFHNWEQTGDKRDLDPDRKAGGLTHGFYHYRALQLNVQKTKFFVMGDGTPGMGPHDLQAEDEVYAIAGCKSLAVLREGERNGTDCFTFVGLCFVDGWMYGRATQGDPTLETLLLY